MRPSAKPPPLIDREAQRAARSRACLFVRAGDALHKRASAYKALIRMSSVVLTWSTGKPPIREHPISPGTMRAYLRDSSGDQLHRRGIGPGGVVWREASAGLLVGRF